MLEDTNISRADYWREMVSKFELSGLTQSEFCRREELAKNRLSHWKRKFEKALPRDSQDSNKNVSNGDFIELPRRAVGVAESQVEIEFKSGVILRIRG